MNYSIIQYGNPLDPSKYTIDPENKTFSSEESYLVLDFSGEEGWTFTTGPYCIFRTGPYCTFRTGSSCNFITRWDCTFKTGEKCVIIRRDIYEIIEIPEGIQIKLKGFGVLGYEIIPQKKIITIDGKDITISEDSFNELKRQLTGE